MVREFRLPDIGEGLTEAEIVRWLVPEGERVAADQPIVEVETDKAVVELPSPYEGVVVRYGGVEGETIEVGAVLVVIGDESDLPGEEPFAPAPEPTGAGVGSGPSPRSEVATGAPIVGSLSEDAEELVTSLPPSDVQFQERIKALPVVRKLAREMGVDLHHVLGSGAQGRITREDVLGAAASGSTTRPEPGETPATAEEIPADEIFVDTAAEPAPLLEPEPVVTRDGDEAEPASEPVTAESVELGVPTGADDERRPMTRLRRTIASNMARSWTEVPHVTTFDDVDATRLLEVRAALAARHGTKIPIEALVVKAVIPALEAFPEFNATVDGETVVLHHRHDIGIAVDTPDGLLVAVIREADAKGILELASEVARLGEGAKRRTLAPAELGGQTFTVSNIGAVGGGHGTPIIPPGTSAILSVGRAREKPIVIDDGLGIAPLMPISLSYDHRVIDGAQGRRFVALILENLEEPALFMAD